MFAAVLGAFVAFVVALVGLPPSPDALAEDAAALVLPDSELLQVGANTGATFIVGWERWGNARFEDERSRGVVQELMLERALDRDWRIEEVSINQLGNWIHASTWLTRAEIRVGPQFHAGEPLTSSQGQVTVSRNEGRRAILFWGVVVAGGIGGAAVGRWAIRRPGVSE